MRIYTSQNEPLDFCKSCAPSEAEALYEYGDLGDGPDDRGNCFAYDTDHPDYESWDYRCEYCGILLSDEDQ